MLTPFGIEIKDASLCPPSVRKAAICLLSELVGEYCEEAWVARGSVRAVALRGDTVAGAAIGTIANHADLDYFLSSARSNVSESNGKTAREILERVESSLVVGDMFALGVSPDFRGLDLGSKLVRFREQSFRERSATSVIAESWVNPIDSKSASIYRSLGYVQVASVPRYWLKADTNSPNNGIRGCPSCGQTCECDAYLFAKLI